MDTVEESCKILNKTSDMKQYKREYNKANKDKWSELRICEECGSEYKRCNHSHHMKSKRHQYGVLVKEHRKLQQIKNLLEV
ncbi:MAG: hypothetical protein Hyperionvirus4_77 [Hyperionvirus sp.]|uniref:Uncharacterized protein n=1 Tax=Hyperionvirus sp. TaxID=2487770 RepID=A0A3G5A7V1_9VIRU|nr:MAG: hypothetical protein Hyperionvirus4_77 [Hyperionvirus sp.]